jgi:DNA invertase Pin-like site-specific DNA recombinase
VAMLLLSVMGAVAEFERTRVRDQRREGIARAKQRGAYRGRRRSLHPEQIEEVRKRVEAGDAKARIAGEFGICRQTLYRLLPEYEPRH